MGGTLLAVGSVVAGLVVVTLGVDLAASFVVAAVEGQSATWPTFAAVVQGYGSALLVLGGTTATVLLLGYLLCFAIVSLGLTARRDIAS